MTKEQFERESNYGVVMALAREMVKRGIINQWDYSRADTMFIHKYHPPIGSLQPAINPKKP
jgi:hypothetical protein